MEFFGTFWALIPPIVAIALALITKETFSSLFVGILVGALMYAGFNPVGTMDAMVSEGLVPAVADNAGIFIFLVILGVMVALVNATGGAAAFGTWAAKHIKTRAGASLATFALGVLIFIDDYFNCLTVGSVMRPVTDGHRISRAKLGYLIDATAAPICMIAPVSSWAAAVSGVASDLNVNGIQLFISAIPFNFYSLLTLVFVIAICIMGFDYGPMAKAEIEAIKNGELGSLGNDKPVENSRANLWDMLLPIIVLIITSIIAMLYVGGFFGVDAWGGTDCAGSIIDSFGNTDAFIALPWGGIVALLFTIVYLLLRKVVNFKEAMECLPKGFIAMVP
ncbi:MAG: Na+/H+ antiporter NhaC family protein, partial [Coriobacteriales bacterium]|nr:Na+/H+ antiporter NhaC family protein [Coriobacteriales bacterium]